MSTKEEALSSVQSVFEHGRASYIDANLLHRLVLAKDLSTILRRKDELKADTVNKDCKRVWNEFTWQINPFYIACYTNQEELALLLLEYGGADPNHLCVRQDPGGDSVHCAPLWWASSHGMIRLCKALLARGAQTDIGEDPIKEARDEETLILLCDHAKVG